SPISQTGISRWPTSFQLPVVAGSSTPAGSSEVTTMRLKGLRIVFAVLTLGAAGTSFAADASSNAKDLVTTRVTVTGAVEHPLDLAVADLGRLPPHRITEVPLICQSGANRGKLE